MTVRAKLATRPAGRAARKSLTACVELQSQLFVGSALRDKSVLLVSSRPFGSGALQQNIIYVTQCQLLFYGQLSLLRRARCNSAYSAGILRILRRRSSSNASRARRHHELRIHCSKFVAVSLVLFQNQNDIFPYSPRSVPEFDFADALQSQRAK